MKAKFGAIVVAGSGKIGGHVASRNKGGAYFRTKVTPVNRNTEAQVAARSRLSSLSQAWASLTDAMRQSWNNAVSAFAVTDVFGDLKSPTGFNLFGKLNNNLLGIGESTLDYAPVPVAVPELLIDSFEAVIGENGIVLNLAEAIPGDVAAQVFATPPLSPGKSFVSSEYRLIGVLDAGDGIAEDMTSAYNAKFGALANAGQRVFIKVVPVSALTGQKGIGSQSSAVVSLPAIP